MYVFESIMDAKFGCKFTFKDFVLFFFGFFRFVLGFSFDCLNFDVNHQEAVQIQKNKRNKIKSTSECCYFIVCICFASFQFFEFFLFSRFEKIYLNICFCFKFVQFFCFIYFKSFFDFDSFVRQLFAFSFSLICQNSQFFFFFAHFGGKNVACILASYFTVIFIATIAAIF